MTTISRYIILSLSSSLLCLIILTACGLATTDRQVWDESNNTLTINDYKIQIHLPQEGEWVIADPDSLPSGMIYCAVDRKKDLLFAAVDPETVSLHSFTPNDLKTIISDLTRQDSTLNVTYGDITLNKIQAWQSVNAISFRRTIHIAVPDETENITVTYDGVIAICEDKPLIFFITHSGEAKCYLNTIIDNVTWI